MMETLTEVPPAKRATAISTVATTLLDDGSLA